MEVDGTFEVEISLEEQKVVLLEEISDQEVEVDISCTENPGGVSSDSDITNEELLTETDSFDSEASEADLEMADTRCEQYQEDLEEMEDQFEILSNLLEDEKDTRSDVEQALKESLEPPPLDFLEERRALKISGVWKKYNAENTAIEEFYKKAKEDAFQAMKSELMQEIKTLEEDAKIESMASDLKESRSKRSSGKVVKVGKARLIYNLTDDEVIEDWKLCREILKDKTKERQVIVLDD